MSKSQTLRYCVGLGFLLVAAYLTVNSAVTNNTYEVLGAALIGGAAVAMLGQVLREII